MKKYTLFLTTLVVAIAVPSVAFAQYGGSVIQSPSVGGGGGGSTPNQTIIAGITINGGAQTTDSTRVTIVMPQTSGDQMAISNEVDFSGSSWVPYRTTVEWILQPGNGQKTVYAKFRQSSTGGTTAVYTGSITLTGSANSGNDIPGATPASGSDSSVTSGQSGAGSCALTPGNPYRLSTARAVFYVTDQCTKRPFRSSAVFFTYFTSWNDVRITTVEALNAVPNDAIAFNPWGPLYNPRYGALVKVVGDPKVYLLLGNQKYWITSEAVFNALRYQWSWVEDVDARLLARYDMGSEITDTTRHPNHTLIKYEGSPRVYKLIDDKKSWIANEAAFLRLGYRWDRIVTVSDSEQYPDGPDLE